MKTIDTKSLLIGILATVLVMVTVGAVGKPSSEIGRYQQVNWDKSAYHILDTSTGETWQAGKAFAGVEHHLKWVKRMSPVKQKD